MGKKKAGKGRVDESSDGGSDGAWGKGAAAELDGFGSDDGYDGPGDESRAEKEAMRIGAMVDALGEKRTATREAGLAGLAEVLSARHGSHGEALDRRSDELGACLLACLKRGGNETALAAQALGVVFLALGPGSHRDELWRRAEQRLILVAGARNRNGDADSSADDASAEALWAYCVGCAVCGSRDAEQNEQGLDLCGLLGQGGTFDDGFVAPQTRLTALKGWRFLASVEGGASLGARRRRGATVVLPVVAALLGAGSSEFEGDTAPALAGGGAGSTGPVPSIELRSEAGLVAVQLAEDYAADVAATEEKGLVFGPASGGEAALWPRVVFDLERLSHETSKKMSKDLKKEQHATFRRLHRAASALLDGASGAAAAAAAAMGSDAPLDGGAPSKADGHALAFPGGEVECVSWRQLAALHGLRRSLGGGLGAHLGAGGSAAGALMGDALDLADAFGDGGEGEGEDDESSETLRGKGSSKGRAKTARRGKERSNKQQLKDSFFEE